MTSRRRFKVYVIDLKKAVLNDRRFREANPQYAPGKPCVYVGMTGIDPTIRFDQHVQGYKASRLAYKYGKRLRTDVVESRGFRAQTFENAQVRERDLAVELRGRGWGVSQA